MIAPVHKLGLPLPSHGAERSKGWWIRQRGKGWRCGSGAWFLWDPLASPRRKPRRVRLFPQGEIAQRSVEICGFSGADADAAVSLAADFLLVIIFTYLHVLDHQSFDVKDFC